MSRRPGPRAVVAAVLTALVTGVLAGLPVSGARAAGDGDPVVLSPFEGQVRYEGFTGPYRVDFSNAPAGLYAYRVERTPVGEEPVVVGSGTVTTTTGTGTVQLTLPGLDPAPAYRFVIADDATGAHRDSVTFEVRAGAQPRCSVVVPSTLRVNTAEEVVHGRLSSNCTAAHIEHAHWDVKNLARGTYVNTLAYYENFKDFWKFFDGQPLGIYVLKPGEAVNADGDDIVQNQPQTVVRLDARISLTGTRDGSYVTLRPSVRKYSRSANAFGPWGKHAVALSYRTCSTCAWVHFKTVTTNLSGAASHRFRAPTARTYRATSGGTSTYWAPYPDYLRL
jgi:hypothetical protein